MSNQDPLSQAQQETSSIKPSRFTALSLLLSAVAAALHTAAAAYVTTHASGEYGWPVSAMKWGFALTAIGCLLGIAGFAYGWAAHRVAKKAGKYSSFAVAATVIAAVIAAVNALAAAAVGAVLISEHIKNERVARVGEATVKVARVANLWYDERGSYAGWEPSDAPAVGVRMGLSFDSDAYSICINGSDGFTSAYAMARNGQMVRFGGQFGGELWTEGECPPKYMYP